MLARINPADPRYAWAKTTQPVLLFRSAMARLYGETASTQAHQSAATNTQYGGNGDQFRNRVRPCRPLLVSSDALLGNGVSTLTLRLATEARRYARRNRETKNAIICEGSFESARLRSLSADVLNGLASRA